jgi:hypothetical protein
LFDFDKRFYRSIVLYLHTVFKFVNRLIGLNFYLGAVRDALGCAATGCFTRHKHLYEVMHKAAAVTGDRVWRMPLWELHTDSVIGKLFSPHIMNIFKYKKKT